MGATQEVVDLSPVWEKRSLWSSGASRRRIMDASDMGEHGKDAKPFRVRTYVWDTSDEEDPQACELLVSDWVEAANAREAAATAKLDHAPATVDRLIVDVQRSSFSPNDKAVDWTPWRIAVVWLTGLGASEDAVRQHLERTVPSFVVERDDAGNLGVAAAAPSYLAWEAMEDLEDVLHDALGDVASEAMSSGMETRVRPDQPTAEELWRELVESAEHGMVAASPPTAAVPEIEEVAPEGPPERELICDLLLRLAQEQTPDLASLAEDHDCSEFTVEQSLRSIERWDWHCQPAKATQRRFFTQVSSSSPAEGMYLSRRSSSWQAVRSMTSTRGRRSAAPVRF